MDYAFPAAVSYSSSAGYSLELVVAIIILFGIARGIKGRRYTKLRVLRTPLTYLIFTLAAVFITSRPSIYAQLTILLLPLGFPIGSSFGGDVKFFYKNGEIYYKRSPSILVLWAIALIARASIEIFSIDSLSAIIVFNAILSFTTGMLLGEAVHILRTEKPEQEKEKRASLDFAGEK
ncbi:MAG: hypothetical protein QXF80_04015 [Thermoplasmatales archaeon]